MSEWRLILETSGRVGQVGLANGERLVHVTTLDEKRRHARDLTAAIREQFVRESITVSDLNGILVSVGPGGYTGLRVGLTTAKVLAYASGVPLVPVPTFHAIAAQARSTAGRLWVIADALQGKMYFQPFDQNREPLDELKLVPADDWLPRADADVWLTGPGVATFGPLLPEGANVVGEEERNAKPAGILLASRRRSALSQEDLFRIEPLYLRGSSAEEKARSQADAPGS